MKTSEKKKKVSSEGMTTREKMLARKKNLAEKGSANSFVFPKDGTTRIRILNPGPEDELAVEVVRFYLNRSIISPATFDEPCPIMEKYLELKDSKDPDDMQLAKKMVPRKRFVVAALVYKDDKGKELDYNGEPRLVMIPSSVYQDITDLYLDEDEAGDMTDVKDGYDIKIDRSGKGQFDTNYSVRQCKSTSIDKKYRKPVDLKGMLSKEILPYDELEEELNKFLNADPDDDEDEAPKKKKKVSNEGLSSKKSKKSSDVKKKKRHGDI